MCVVITFAVLLGIIAVLVKVILDLHAMVRGLRDGTRVPHDYDEEV